MSDAGRYSRQERLAEVGAPGQDRILSARVDVRGRDGASVEALYLSRAGVRQVGLLPDADPAPFAHAWAFHNGAARRVGAGAWRALVELRSILGITVP